MLASQAGGSFKRRGQIYAVEANVSPYASKIYSMEGEG